MAEIHALRSGAQVRREASEWIARLAADNVSAEDRARFKEWQGAHASHARAFEEVSGTWQQLSHTGELVRAVTSGQAFAASTQRAIRRSLRSTKQRKVFALAAVLATIALVSWQLMEPMVPRTLFQTTIGERATVQLPDGSSLELNSNSRARVEYSMQARVIRLDRGEAFFEVEGDAQRPFWVIAGDSSVRAIGTAFNVRYVDSAGRPALRVTVNEGKVAVAPAPKDANNPDTPDAGTVPVILKAGEQAEVGNKAARVHALAPAELTRSVAWRSGTIYFREERLASVVDEMSRYTTRKIVIADDTLRDLGIGGTFETNAQGGEALLTTLEDGFGLKIRWEGKTAYIER